MDIGEFVALTGKGTALAGLDIGDKTIGVAVSDTLWWTATPLKTVFRKSFRYDMEELSKILAGREISGFVSGLPLEMSGNEGERAAVTRAVAQQIADRFGKPVFFQDERLSSAAAERVMIGAFDMSRKKRKERLDSGAAAFILQGFLDRVRNLP